jgi:hypothetical protein
MRFAGIGEERGMPRSSSHHYYMLMLMLVRGRGHSTYINPLLPPTTILS